MDELKAYQIDPEKSNGWSFDLSLIQEAVLFCEKEEPISCEQIDSVFRFIVKKFPTRTPALPDPCTVEQWEEITGETFPDDGIVSVELNGRNSEGQFVKGVFIERYGDAQLYSDIVEIYIVQTAKPAPEGGEGER